MIRRALITGVNGQDGSYLAEWLRAQDYQVFGTDKNPQPDHLAQTCGLDGMIIADLGEPDQLGRIVREVRPHEVYHLAAHHFSSQTDDNQLGRMEPFIRVNLLAANSALEAIAADLPACRFFYAASAHIFGQPASSPQDEATRFQPGTPYAISKCAGVYLCRYFRRSRSVFASVGILYNHESPRRGPSFITTMLARAAALTSLGKPELLVVRNLDAVVDWGAAQDYIRAMWLILQEEAPDDFIVASGRGRTVRDFAHQAFETVGSSADGKVVQDSAGSRTEQMPLVGDPAKVQRKTGWKAEISFEAMVTAMVTAQRSALQQDRSV